MLKMIQLMSPPTFPVAPRFVSLPSLTPLSPTILQSLRVSSPLLQKSPPILPTPAHQGWLLPPPVLFPFNPLESSFPWVISSILSISWTSSIYFLSLHHESRIHLLETGMLESGREDPSTGKSNPCLAGQWGSVGAFPHQPCPFCTVSWSRL